MKIKSRLTEKLVEISPPRDSDEAEVMLAIPSFHEGPAVVREHGQLWATCDACGWQASANDSNRGVDLETVTEGDGSCEENA